MRILKVRDVEIGKGIPKIIAPICDKTEKEILYTAKKFSIIPVDFDILDIDIVEWRVDWYEYYNDYSKIEIVLEKLRKILKNIPIMGSFIRLPYMITAEEAITLFRLPLGNKTFPGMKCMDVVQREDDIDICATKESDVLFGQAISNSSRPINI